MKNLFHWFKINSITAYPGKFQFMILGKKNHFEYNRKVESKESDKVQILGITITKGLNFISLIENLRCTTQYKLHAL